MQCIWFYCYPAIEKIYSRIFFLNIRQIKPIVILCFQRITKEKTQETETQGEIRSEQSGNIIEEEKEMADIRNAKNWGFETRQLHIGQEQADPATDARAVPIYASTSYVFHNSQHAADRFGLRDAGNIYGRLTNPTQDVFEQRIASLEGGAAALAVASGAAAIAYTFQALAKAGEHIVASKTIYGGTYNLLAHTLPQTSSITATFVDPEEEGAFEAAIQENTKAIFVETLGNPNSNLADLEKLAEVAHRHQLPLVVDSTFATPYLIRPIEYGADLVVHSATKFIGGHGTAIGGVIVDSGNFDWNASGRYLSRRIVYRCSRCSGICDIHPCSSFEGYWRDVIAISCVYLFAGAGDFILTRGAACEQCIENRGLSGKTSTGGGCSSSVA